MKNGIVNSRNATFVLMGIFNEYFRGRRFTDIHCNLFSMLNLITFLEDLTDFANETSTKLLNLQSVVRFKHNQNTAQYQKRRN